MVSIAHNVGRDMANQMLLNLQRRGCRSGYKPKPVADTEYMGIDSHRGLTKGHRLDDVGSLAANTRQRQQSIH